MGINHLGVEFLIVRHLTEKPLEKHYEGILLLVRLFSLFRCEHGPSVHETLSSKILVYAGILCFDFKWSSGLFCEIDPGEQTCCKHMELSCRILIFCSRGFLELPGENHASEGII